jgi:DNA polymerase III subunit delta'
MLKACSMAEEIVDPRETPLHPRLRPRLIGHGDAVQAITTAFDSGKPHHAWMIMGEQGVGKATLAYKVAEHVLGGDEQAKRWIAARSHPDLFVLERGLTKTKPVKLRGEIAVDDVRDLISFFGKTASRGGWRVGIVDVVDDLNTESANALLKLVEEPPPQVILLLLVNQPGRALRTLRSRCMKLKLPGLKTADTRAVLGSLDLTAGAEAISSAAALANGSPGRALQLLTSQAAQIFQKFREGITKRGMMLDLTIVNQFGPRGPSADDMAIFADLLLDWLAREAAARNADNLARLHHELGQSIRIGEGYNLDRRATLAQAIRRVDEALGATLKAA